MGHYNPRQVIQLYYLCMLDTCTHDNRTNFIIRGNHGN